MSVNIFLGADFKLPADVTESEVEDMHRYYYTYVHQVDVMGANYFKSIDNKQKW